MTQNKNIKIAITGGIGSGKSTVAEILRSHGEQVFSCDEIYASLLEDDTELSGKLVAEFGDGILSTGMVDRQKLSCIVFGDESLLQKLNLITHPQILKEINFQTKEVPLAFVEVPLLFESGWQNYFDGVIIVLRSLEDRIASVILRSNLTEEDVKNRIKNQFNYDNLDFAKYYVIHNCDNLTNLEQKTLKILKNLKEDYF